MTKHALASLSLALLTAMGFAACDSSTETTSEVSTDCMLTAVTLGKLPCTAHYLKADGTDSTYTYTVTGSLYKMSIDQRHNRIYNVDSLPLGVDPAKIVFASMSGTGACAIRSTYSGTDTTFVTTDSTDFRQPRVFKVYSLDGTISREYTMEVRVHQEEADSMTWRQAGTPNPQLAALTQTRAITTPDGRISLFGLHNAQPSVATTTASSAPQWTVQPLAALGGGEIIPRSVTLYNNQLYALTATGQLLKAAQADGTWSAVPTNLGSLKQLVAASTDSLYALTAAGFYASHDGLEWTASAADTPAQLPATVTGGVCLTSNTDAMLQCLVLAGANASGQPVVWKRDVDLTGNESYPWLFYPATNENPYYLPLVTPAPALVAYDNQAWLVAKKPAGTGVSFRLSRDFGRTWKEKAVAGPDLAAATNVAATVDADGWLWLIGEGTGAVWRGRINRLGWAEVVTKY